MRDLLINALLCAAIILALSASACFLARALYDLRYLVEGGVRVCHFQSSTVKYS
jgi:hypothetical protein